MRVQFLKELVLLRSMKVLLMLFFFIGLLLAPNFTTPAMASSPNHFLDNTIAETGILSAVDLDAVIVESSPELANLVAFAEGQMQGYGPNGKFLAPIEAPDPNAIKIYTAQDLDDVRNNLSGSYVLMNDIDLKDYNSGQWEPIGDAWNSDFSGTFDGQGYVIKNLAFNSEYTENGCRYVGLFGSISNAIIKNVGLEEINIDIEASEYEVSFGSLVGTSWRKPSLIFNCYNSGDISIKSDYGGFAIGGINGDFNGVISSCYNTANISVSYCYAVYVGGISGWNNNSSGCQYFSNCYNTGNISVSSYDGDAYVGGIYGNNRNPAINCYNSGNISAYSAYGYSYIGGIGESSGDIIFNCYNNGQISTDGFSVVAGGILGRDSGIISNCFNTGDVSAFSKHEFNAYAGGIVGVGYDNTITNCFNTGTILAVCDGYVTAGGIIADNRSKIANCYNSGDVLVITENSAGYNNSYSCAGGISGCSFSPGDITIANCVVLSNKIQVENPKNPSASYSFLIGYNANGVNNLALTGISGNAIDDATERITQSEAERKSTYEKLGWDFNNTWHMVPGYDYPQLLRPKSTQYLYTVSDNIVTITNYIGGRENAVIPEMIDGLPVTTIGASAFSDNIFLKSVKFPSSLNSFLNGNSYSAAFKGCINLESIVFEDCAATIGDYVFQNLPKLREVKLGNKMASIGVYAFSDCSALTSITIPSTLTSIGNAAFRNCTGLVNVKLEEGVKGISDYAFANCGNLVRIDIPTSVTSIGNNTFSSSPKVVIYTWPDSYAETYAKAWGIPVRYLFENAASIEVSLPSPASPGQYSNTKIVLTNKTTGTQLPVAVTDKLTYVFGGLDTGGIYKVALTNSLGYVLSEIENIVLLEGVNSIAFTNLLSIKAVTLKVLDNTGTDLTAQTTVQWYNESGSFLTQGAVLSGTVAGAKLHFKVELNNTLGERFINPTQAAYIVTENNNRIVITLSPIPLITISGTVKDTRTGIALPGAAVSISQMLNGKHPKTIIATTDIDGVFSAQVFNDTSMITVSSYNYFNQVISKPGFADNENLEEIKLTPISGATIKLNINYTYSTVTGESPFTSDFYHDYQNLQFTVNNQTQGKAIANYIYQYPYLIFPESANAKDKIWISISGGKNDFNPVQTDVTLNNDLETEATFDMVQHGSLRATLAGSANGENVALVYNASGKLVGAYDFYLTTVNTGPLPDGNYTVVLMGKSLFFKSIQNFSDLVASGLVQGVDYERRQVEIKSGLISQVDSVSIPKFDDSKFYYTNNDETLFSVNKTSAVLGTFFTLSSRLTFSDAYKNQISDVKLIIQLPENCTLFEGSVVYGAKNMLASYLLNSDTLTIPLVNVKDSVRFCVIPSQGGKYALNAFIDFYLSGERIRQPIGTAKFEVAPILVNLPEETSQKSIWVSGIAAPGAVIVVLDGDVEIGRTRVLLNGEWRMLVQLNEPSGFFLHPIHVESISNDTQRFSNTNWLVYDEELIEVSKITMINTQIINQCITVYDYLNPATNTPYYSYNPSYPDYTFITEFTNNPKEITRVNINITTNSGNIKTLPAVYNSVKKEWIATGQFVGFNNAPVGLSVSYLTDREAYLADRGYDWLVFNTNLDSYTHLYAILKELNRVYLDCKEIENSAEYSFLANALGTCLKHAFFTGRTPEDICYLMKKNDKILEYIKTLRDMCLDVFAYTYMILDQDCIEISDWTKLTDNYINPTLAYSSNKLNEIIKSELLSGPQRASLETFYSYIKMTLEIIRDNPCLIACKNGCKGGITRHDSDFFPIRPIIDPSGYVYEAVASNRIPGVTTTAFYKTTKEDDIINLWDASEYGQNNPLITNEIGWYEWDVPIGLWQVKYEKEGYQTSYSDWLPVPPPQLDVNIGMVSYAQPKIERVNGYEDYIEVVFDKYMDITTIISSNVKVVRNGTPVALAFEYPDKEPDPSDDNHYYARIVHIKPATGKFNMSDTVTLSITKDVLSYAGVGIASEFTQTVPIKPEPKQLALPEEINLEYGESKKLEVSILPLEAAIGKKITAMSGSSYLVTVDAEALTNAEGKAVFTVTGELSGATVIEFSVEGTLISQSVKANIALPKQQLTKTDKPTANLTSGGVNKGTLLTFSTTTPDAIIYYTLDGSCPCAEGSSSRKIYGGPIAINEDMMILAAAYKEGMDYSDTLGLYFLVNQQAINVTSTILYQPSPTPATVKLYNSTDTTTPITTATTATMDGSYSIAVPIAPQGTRYNLVVTKPGYLSYTIKNLALMDGEGIPTVDIRQLAGDVNGDGIVNAVDLTCLLSVFNREPEQFKGADIDGNGIVNAADLTYLLAGFNKRDVVVGGNG